MAEEPGCTIVFNYHTHQLPPSLFCWDVVRSHIMLNFHWTITINWQYYNKLEKRMIPMTNLMHMLVSTPSATYQMHPVIHSGFLWWFLNWLHWWTSSLIIDIHSLDQCQLVVLVLDNTSVSDIDPTLHYTHQILPQCCTAHRLSDTLIIPFILSAPVSSNKSARTD